MKVLVTGGAGFIGSHLCELLLERGYSVRVIDNLSLGNRKWLPVDVEFLEGDICNLRDCEDAIKGVEGVFHLAAMSKVAPSLSDPNMLNFCTDQNVIGTLNILSAARDSQIKIKKVVYSASSTVYGDTPPPHLEDMLPNCLTPYALTKYVGEQYCKLFDRLHDLPTVSLRYFQVCGPRQPNTGPYAVVAGIFIQQMKAGSPLTIHGDGSQQRDFVHVRDIAEANIRAFEGDARGTVINIGMGESYSIKELADLISSNQIVGLPRRRADSDCTLADLSRCKQALNWTPQITFREIVDEMMSS